MGTKMEVMRYVEVNKTELLKFTNHTLPGEIICKLNAYWFLSAELQSPVVLTGSLAMYLMGLEPYREFKDLDIIVINPTNRDYDKLDLIREVSPLYQHIPDSVKYKWEAKFQFTCKGVNVDVFVEKGIDFLWQAVMIGTSINFVRVNSLQNILKARRRLGREKDITSIFKFIQKIVNL